MSDQTIDRDQTIDLSAGAIEYTFPRTITETGGLDISGDPVLVSLGSYDGPGEWVPADIERPSDSSAVVKLLVGADQMPGPGVYYLWVKITDLPEVVPRRSHGQIIIR